MPSKDELATLVEKRPEGQRKIDTNAFPDMVGETETWYWSSTPSGASNGWLVRFGGGGADGYYRSSANAVRLVRGGQ